MNTSDEEMVFDYRTLRFLMGVIALILPIVVSLRSSVPLSSISASYYTEARDFLVGLLFFVAAFLFAYKGHTVSEARASNVACLAAILVAVFPTSCDTCASTTSGSIHYASAAILFSILAYFCLFPFRVNTKGQTGKKGRRDLIYVVCGLVIIVCLLIAAFTKFILPGETYAILHVTYWAEFGALWAFGFAWLVAGKTFPWLVDDEEIHTFNFFSE